MLCRIVLAEDHKILREGLRGILNSEPGMEVVGEAADGREAVQCAQTLRPEVLILDLSMPRTSGLDALQEIKRVSPETRVVVLTVHQEEEYVFTALEAGADGYVLKDAGSDELLLAIRSVLSGERYLCPPVATKLVSEYLGFRKGAARSRLDDLSAREREVLKLVAEGHRTRDIAQYLCISTKTVDKHRASVMRKLKVRTVPALVSYAIEKGIISR